jgi:hypothetical protein
MEKDKEATETSSFKDRKGGLVAFGIVQIFMGVLCLLMIPLMIFGMIASTMVGQTNVVPVSMQMLAQSVFFYLLIAVWFIWMGIGSIKTRRWARALVLVSSWIWLICGIVGFIFWLIFMPNMYGPMAFNGQMPPYALSLVKFITTAFLIVLYIILPGIFVLFYGSKNIKATVESRSPNVTWTDKCPLPVLALSFLFAISVLSIVQMAFYNFVFPFFGFLLTGTAGAVMLVILIILFIYLAVATYKLQMPAWWTAVVVTILGTISGIVTFSRVGLLDFYQKMNFPEQQIELIKQTGMLEKLNVTWYTLFWTVIFLVYLLYVKRFFNPVSKSE